MAYWDSEKKTIVRVKPEPYPDHPGWWYIDCGCCAGLEWGGDYPRECHDCNGSGFVAYHEDSGALAEYPGGPFLGSMGKHRIKIDA